MAREGIKQRPGGREAPPRRGISKYKHVGGRMSLRPPGPCHWPAGGRVNWATGAPPSHRGLCHWATGAMPRSHFRWGDGAGSKHLPALFFTSLNKKILARSQAGPEELTNWVCLAVCTFAGPFRVICGHRKKVDFEPIIPFVSRSPEGTRAVNWEREKRAGIGPWVPRAALPRSLFLFLLAGSR